MKNLLLSVALIALPVGLFAAVEAALPSPSEPAATAQATPALGDLARYHTIVSDVRTLAAKGNLSAAETRVTDFETLWDKEAPDLRARDRAAWNRIDAAADDAFAALRTASPDPAQVGTTLATLDASLDGGHAAPDRIGTARLVAGVAVTDDTGRPLPCEEMLGQLKSAAGGLTDAALKSRVADLQATGTERCNADDDANADAAFAKAIALTMN